jgi:hypothetical protein
LGKRKNIAVLIHGWANAIEVGIIYEELTQQDSTFDAVGSNIEMVYSRHG